MELCEVVWSYVELCGVLWSCVKLRVVVGTALINFSRCSKLTACVFKLYLHGFVKRKRFDEHSIKKNAEIAYYCTITSPSFLC